MARIALWRFAAIAALRHGREPARDVQPHSPRWNASCFSRPLDMPAHLLATEVNAKHIVQFYDDDAILADSVARFLKVGFDLGQPAVVIATERHRTDLREQLRALGVDVAERERAGSLLVLDARDTLVRFVVNGRPDPARFERTITDLLARLAAAAPGRSVRAYGEMVDLLCRDGLGDAAIELERLWNDIANRHDFALFCAYVMDHFGENGERLLEQVKEAHASTVEHGGPHLRKVIDATREADAEAFRLLVGSIVDHAIFLIDRQGIVRTWNPGAARVKGWHADEIVGRHFSCFYPPEDVKRGKCDRLLALAASEGRAEDKGWRVKMDGSRFFAHVVITKVCDATGRHVGFAKLTRDLTEAQRLEEEATARRAAEHAADLLGQLQNVTAALVAAQTLDEIGTVVSHGGEVLGARSGTCLRVDGEELEIIAAHGVGRDLLDRWRRFPVDASTPPGAAVITRQPLWVEDPAEVRAKYAPFKSMPVVGSVAALPVVVRERVVAVLAYSFPIARTFTAEERAFLVSVATQAAQAFDRAEAFAQATAANRMKDEFLAVVSHELRTPLTSILGWSAILKQNPATTQAVHAVETIHRSAQAQLKLIEDLVDVSRITAGSLSLEIGPVDLAAVVLGAADIVRPSAHARRITLEVDAPEPIMLQGDAPRLQQVLLNILMNAVKFSEIGGRVSVTVRRGERATITVRDFGRGIAPEALPRVFRRFLQIDRTSTRRGAGLGLGLAIAQEVVKLHGGDIAAHSDGLGKGATFTVHLPIHEQTNSVPPSEWQRLDGLRVLVVDDEDDARELAAAVLTMAGARVSTADGAHTAREVLARDRPDVVVTDLTMHAEDGWSFIEWLRALPSAEGGNTPAIALTALTSDAARTRSERAGIERHLTKPIGPAELIASVASLRS